jgi:CTD small phosphatase-like protein 2
MSDTLTQLKVRRSIRILHKQITRKSLKDLRKKPSVKPKSAFVCAAKPAVPSFSDIVHQVSSSKQEYFSQLLLALKFIKGMKPVDHIQLASKAVHLRRRPMYEHAKTVLLDLDETLVHCCENPREAQRSITINLPSGDQLEVGINVRPYALELLTSLSKSFEIIVFTASHKCYADVVLDMLDPVHELIHHRLYRDNCVIVDGVHIKDLRIITNRKLEDMIIVDNAAYSFAYQLENGIPIISWYDDLEDTELMDLAHYLSSISSVKDVRIPNRHTFHLEQLTNKSETLLTQL